MDNQKNYEKANEDEIEIDIVQILLYFKDKWRSILLATVLGAVVGFFIAQFIVAPKYSSYTELYVTNRAVSSGDSLTTSDISASQSLADTYITMLQTGSVRQDVASLLDGEVTSGQLSSMVSFEAVDDTQVVKITVTTESPELSLKVCEAYDSVATDVLKGIVSGGTLSVLTAPEYNDTPVSPNKRNYTLAGALLALVVILAVYFVMSMLNGRVSDEDRLSKKYNLPVLGNVPNAFDYSKELGISKKAIKKNQSLKEKNQQNEKMFLKALILSKETPFQISEAYASIRTNVLFTLATLKNGVIMVTSPTANDIKTTTSINLAISMGQIGARVLLIDADLRNPSIHRYLNYSNKKGLSRVLVGFDKFKDAVVKNFAPGVDFLPAGPMPPSPAAILGSSYMGELISRCAEHYDFVFIDTSPVNMVSDPLVLIPQVSGIIVAVRENKTRINDIDKTIESINLAKGNVIGFVITDVRQSITSEYRSYKYGYGYGESSSVSDRSKSSSSAKDSGRSGGASS